MKRVILVLSAMVAVLMFVSVVTAQAKPASSDKPVEITEGITPPVLLEVASPEYTEAAKKKKIEGTVTLEIVVDTKGKVSDAKVKKGLGYGLDEMAIVAVKEWIYKPARDKDDKPVAVKMDVNTDFYLRD